MNNLQKILHSKNIKIKYIADKCGRNQSRMGEKINNEKLNLTEIKIILRELDMKFEDVFYE